MPLEAATLLQLVALVTWTCLNGTAFHRRNPLFARFFTSLAVFESIDSAASLTFCPGLFKVLDAASPPTVEWFKSLPTATKSGWAVYAVVLEKAQCRPKVYIGSGTSVSIGVAGRLKQYDDGLCFQSMLKRLWMKDTQLFTRACSVGSLYHLLL